MMALNPLRISMRAQPRVMRRAGSPPPGGSLAPIIQQRSPRLMQTRQVAGSAQTPGRPTGLGMIFRAMNNRSAPVSLPQRRASPGPSVTRRTTSPSAPLAPSLMDILRSMSAPTPTISTMTFSDMGGANAGASPGSQGESAADRDGIGMDAGPGPGSPW